MFIRPRLALIFAVSMFSVGLASAEQHTDRLSRIRIAQEKPTRAQIIHCGTKNGMVKESHPLRCRRRWSDEYRAKDRSHMPSGAIEKRRAIVLEQMSAFQLGLLRCLVRRTGTPMKQTL
ncbi:hypothetical protein MA20_20025 [Bradyrhizobium japonicum]|uniref:Uncharacterized protein n=1 Tax=Bradyrhizobium japonicum TaxID=375 RepID=A0A0A3XXK4_BRAJP|nr:hypothetical protein [Bradyrhizobium japonicum]KGT78009.1 hypothetical protein MA20_20025 [Bradyrhizobium japonicum]